MPEDSYELKEEIEQAAYKIGHTWPLYSFVTSNPLSGLENKTFTRAVAEARALFGGRGFPSASQFKQALNEGRIDRDVLKAKLNERGLDRSVDNHLDSLEDADKNRTIDNKLGPQERKLNQILEKWLSSFLDEGRSRWSMPNRDQGFYRAWKQVAQYDHQIPDARQLSELPDDADEALEDLLSDLTAEDRTRVFTYHVTAMPDWIGYIKQRNSRSGDGWANRYPITLTEYLAVRLILADQLGAPILPKAGEIDPKPVFLDNVRSAFLEAWEQSYRNNLLDCLDLNTDESDPNKHMDRSKAQMVFCIDTRSEIIRRHIESTGDYETHGYAGFFGVPVRHRRHGGSSSVEACPPIVEPQHDVHDVPRHEGSDDLQLFKKWMNVGKGTREGLKNIKDNIASAFNYVELSGLFYGIFMLGKTLFPGASQAFGNRVTERVPDYHDVTEPELNGTAGDSMSFKDKVDYADSAFKLMGWESFAPLVVFVGHTSQTSNNPFDSSLRCGACSGNSGAPSARILASICNEKEVRERLVERGHEIPDDTIFLAGRHNTTTDEIRLFDSEIPKEYDKQLESLKNDLRDARKGATAERIDEMKTIRVEDGVDATQNRAADWAQTRPEWGLAGNASFIVGPNRLRHEADLEGRAFLHTYDWRRDPDGSALEQIMQGPVVVCQWINHQYYFSSIDNRIYGSGSKITHNPVGNFGVLQGNGGTLMGGLPLQSLMKTDTELQHAPIRILTVIHAPEERVKSVLNEVGTVEKLVRNNWIDLEVIDPEKDNKAKSLSDELSPGEPSEIAESVLR